MTSFLGGGLDSSEMEEKKKKQLILQLVPCVIFFPLSFSSLFVGFGEGGGGGERGGEGEDREGGRSEEAEERRKRRKSRWSSEEEKVNIPGMPTILPSSLTADQQELYIGMSPHFHFFFVLSLHYFM